MFFVIKLCFTKAKAGNSAVATPLNVRCNSAVLLFFCFYGLTHSLIFTGSGVLGDFSNREQCIICNFYVYIDINQGFCEITIRKFGVYR